MDAVINTIKWFFNHCQPLLRTRCLFRRTPTGVRSRLTRRHRCDNPKYSLRLEQCERRLAFDGDGGFLDPVQHIDINDSVSMPLAELLASAKDGPVSLVVGEVSVGVTFDGPITENSDTQNGGYSWSFGHQDTEFHWETSVSQSGGISLENLSGSSPHAPLAATGITLSTPAFQSFSIGLRDDDTPYAEMTMLSEGPRPTDRLGGYNVTVVGNPPSLVIADAASSPLNRLGAGYGDCIASPAIGIVANSSTRLELDRDQSFEDIDLVGIVATQVHDDRESQPLHVMGSSATTAVLLPPVTSRSQQDDNGQHQTLSPQQAVKDVDQAILATLASQTPLQNRGFDRSNVGVSAKPALLVARASARWAFGPRKTNHPHTTGEGGFLNPPDVVAQTPSPKPTQAVSLAIQPPREPSLSLADNTPVFVKDAPTTTRVSLLDLFIQNVAYSSAGKLATPKDAPRENVPSTATAPLTISETVQPNAAVLREQREPELPTVMKAALAAVFAAGIYSSNETVASVSLASDLRRDDRSWQKRRLW